MALVDVDSWITEFESCNRLSDILLSQLNLRENEQNLSSEYNRYTTAIQVGLKQYNRELHQLYFKLNELTKVKAISSGEALRRKQQLDILQTQLIQCQSKYNDPPTNERAALLRNPALSNANVEYDSDIAPIIDVHDVHTLKQQQIHLLEEQNRGLETLSQSLSRQKQIATQLGLEVEEQNDILDNLTNTIERVETGVNLETRNVGLVSRNDSTWGYWVIIVVLMIAIIVVSSL